MLHDPRFGFPETTVDFEPPRPLCREPEPAESFPVDALGDVVVGFNPLDLGHEGRTRVGVVSTRYCPGQG